VTLGSPRFGTEMSRVGIGHASRELFTAQCSSACRDSPPSRTRVTVIWSRADALVPGARQPHLPGAEVILYDDLGHISMLGSRRVASDIITRLRS
jgi:hypothetical protein